MNHLCEPANDLRVAKVVAARLDCASQAEWVPPADLVLVGRVTIAFHAGEIAKSIVLANDAEQVLDVLLARVGPTQESPDGLSRRDGGSDDDSRCGGRMVTIVVLSGCRISKPPGSG